MLHAHPEMTRIDTDQWRSLQTLLTVSAKARPRIVVIHEEGTLQKLRHSDGEPVRGEVPALGAEIEPRALAEQLYAANAGTTDFVVVLERGAVERYYAAQQDSWSAEEDLDVFVHRGNLALDAQRDGIVVHPGPASAQLGLQFRTGASYDVVVAAVHRFVPPGTHVALGTLRDGRLDASLVLGFDDDHALTHITTAQPAEVAPGDLADVARQVTGWVDGTHGRCALGLFAERSDVDSLLDEGITEAALRQLAAAGRLVASPVPPELADALGVAR